MDDEGVEVDWWGGGGYSRSMLVVKDRGGLELYEGAERWQ